MESKTVRLVSEGRQSYKGRRLMIGEEFDATPEDAADLIVMRWASKAVVPNTDKPKNSYLRRDLRAEK